jgi:glycogen(starch) synthase
MPEKMADYDVLILPSEYQEPISRAMQEAMAMGLLVIGTETGGSGELLVHEETGLVFEAADAQSLAQRLRRALDDAESAAALARAGQARVRNEFNIDLTVDRIEAYLQTLFGRAP